MLFEGRFDGDRPQFRFGHHEPRGPDRHDRLGPGRGRRRDGRVAPLMPPVGAVLLDWAAGSGASVPPGNSLPADSASDRTIPRASHDSAP